MSIQTASWQYTNYSSTFSNKESNQGNLPALRTFFLPCPQDSHLLRSHFIVKSQPNTHIPATSQIHTQHMPTDACHHWKKCSLIYIESSIHCFYASNVALGKLICTSRTVHDSKIIILGKDGTYSLEQFSAIFISLFALSICRGSLLLWC